MQLNINKDLSLTSKCKALHFDVSQTEGEPIPSPGVDELTGSVEGYETLLAAIKEVVPVPISFEQIDSGAKGFYHLEENRIVVQEGMSEAQTVKTLLHEASHQALHSKEAMDSAGEKKSKNQKETEALYPCFCNVDLLNYFP